MSLKFTVLASGSAGNTSYVEADQFGLLIDLGLGPKQLEKRFETAGIGWPQVQAVLLTHTHADHWNDRSFAALLGWKIPLYCHRSHYDSLTASSPAFGELLAANLVFSYEVDLPIRFAPHFSCFPFRVQHDGHMTCGFRFEGPLDLYGQVQILGYAADLGNWDNSLVNYLKDADVLALEFNHDLEMQKNSKRWPGAVARTMSNNGHLSNDQASQLVKKVLQKSESGRLQHLVQLHLSQECNLPNLAAEKVREIIGGDFHPFQIHTASQEEVGPDLVVTEPTFPLARARRARSALASADSRFIQNWLPGWE